MGFYFNTDSITPSKGSGGDSADNGLLETLMHNVVQGNNPVDVNQLEDVEEAIALISGDSGADVVTAINTTGSTVSKGDKVWINHDNNSYKLVNPYGDLQNFSINGSPTIVNKAATNFSTSNYLISNTNNNTFSPGNNPWELVLKFKYNSDYDLSNTPYYFWLKPNTSRYGLSIGTNIHTDNKIRIWLMMSTDGSNWDSWNGWNSDWSGWDEFVFEKDTVYWIRISWTGSEYRLEYSTDGINFALGSTFASYNPIGGGYPLSEIHIGEYYNINSGQGMTIYLDGCYGKINGIITWAPYFPNIDENSQTGIAAESIANGSSGYVTLALQGYDLISKSDDENMGSSV